MRLTERDMIEKRAELDLMNAITAWNARHDSLSQLEAIRVIHSESSKFIGRLTDVLIKGEREEG